MDASDTQRLDRMLDIPRSYTEEIEALRALSREEFLSNADKVGNAKYHFVVAIECCMDIAHHIIATRGYSHPFGQRGHLQCAGGGSASSGVPG